MLIPNIKNVDYSVDVYSYKDFLSDTNDLNGAMISKDKVYSAPAFIKTGLTLKKGIRPVKLYNVNGVIHAYCTDGKVYKKDEKGYTPYNIATLSLPPKIFSIIKDGQNSVVITADKGGYVINDTFSYLGIPLADCYAVYKGVFFCAKARKIYIYGDTDYTGYNVDFNKRKFITVEQSLGGVKKLLPTNNGLFVFCHRGIAVINLSVDKIGFSFKRPFLEIIKPISETVKNVGDVAYFIASDGFYSFDGESVKRLSCVLDGVNYTVLCEAVKSGDYYLLPVNVNGEKRLYSYDVVNKTSGFIKCDFDLITDDGYAFNLDGAESLLLDGNPNEFIWESKKTDYGKQKQKTLCGIYVNSNNPVTVSVISEQATKKFKTTGGAFSSMLSVRSRYYKIRILGDQNSTLTALKVKYRYQGD